MTIFYKRNKIIFAQGERAESAYLIREGQVKLRVASEDGREAVTGILSVGDFIGEGCMLSQEMRSCTAASLTPVALSRISPSDILQDAEFNRQFVAFLLKRNAAMEEDLTDQILRSSEERLARLLLKLSGAREKAVPDTIPRISQETLAGMVGTTRSRVGYFLKRFEKRGLISYEDGIRVNSTLSREFIDVN
jgi:CRP-like cAMP-binding protein